MESSGADLWESAKNNDLARLSCLLSGGEDVNQRDDQGLTPLHVAATFGALEATKLLLLRGADTNASDWESGWTPLHKSFYLGHVKLSLLLLKHGAKLGDEFEGDWRRDLSMNRPTGRSIRTCDDWDIHDHDGNTPLDLLCEHLKVSVQLNESETTPQRNRHNKIRAGMTANDRSEVFTFGKADFQLGIPLPKASSDVSRPRRIEDLLMLPVCDIAASKYHSMALTTNGHVYSWGHGRTGRLGHGDEYVQPSPCRIASLVSKKVVKISASENHSAAVTADGELYTWGSDRFGQLGHGNAGNKHSFTPRKVDALRRSAVTDVATGGSHTIAATSKLEVYTWGSNKNGQLGLREMEMSNNPCPSPRLVHFSAVSKRVAVRSDRVVIQVAAGSVNSIVNFMPVAYGPSAVFQWGWTVSSPQRITFNTGSAARDFAKNEGILFNTNRLPAIAQVAAGKFHNVALTNFGAVYSWGIGSDVLGHGPAETYSTKPQLVEALLPENGGGKVIHISASSSRTCAVTDTGEVFSWGFASEPGVLGSGSKRYQPMPKRVVGVQRGVRACVAEDHTLVLLQTSMPTLPHSELFSPQQPSSATKQRTRSTSTEHIFTGDVLEMISSIEDEQLVDPDVMHFPEVFRMDEDMSEDERSGSHSAPSSPSSASRATATCTTVHHVPTLAQICEHTIANQIDTKNAVSLFINAEILGSDSLVHFAAEYIRRNFDAILVVGKQSDIDLLLEDVGDQVHAKLKGIIPSQDVPFRVGVEPASPSVPAKPSSMGPAQLAKAIKLAKKKLATIETLQQQQAVGIILLPEQLEKLQRREAIQKDILMLQQRLMRAEKEQELRAAARKDHLSQSTPQGVPGGPVTPGIDLSKETLPKPTAGQGRRKFVSLEAHEQRGHGAADSPDHTQIEQTPRLHAWGTPTKPVVRSSSPIPVPDHMSNHGTSVSPVLNRSNVSAVRRNSPGTASSPSTQVNLAALLNAKPKHKSKRSGVEALGTSPSERGWNMTAAASPNTPKSLIDIQHEEEQTKSVSTRSHHDGNESVWFVERRRRAGSLESIIAEQEAIAAVEQFERMEQERLMRQQETQQRQRKGSSNKGRSNNSTKSRNKQQKSKEAAASGGDRNSAASEKKKEKKRQYKPRRSSDKSSSSRKQANES